MQGSAGSIWFSAIVGALGFAFAVANLPYALLWFCLWFGMAIFFVGARRRFLAFVPTRPPASLKDLGIPDDALSGAPANPWWILIFVCSMWVTVAAVPLLVPGVSLIGYGIGIALTLGAAAAWLATRQRASVKIAKQLLGAPKSGERRLVGVVRNDQPALVRETCDRRDAHGRGGQSDHDLERVWLSTRAAARDDRARGRG